MNYPGKIPVYFIFVLVVLISQVIFQASFAQIIVNGNALNALYEVGDSTDNDDEALNHSSAKDTIEMNKGNFISPYELIKGKFPGMMITSLDGRPGGDYDVKFINSINSYVLGSSPYDHH